MVFRNINIEILKLTKKSHEKIIKYQSQKSELLFINGKKNLRL